VAKKKKPSTADTAASIAKPGVGAAVRSLIQGTGSAASGIGAVALPAMGIAAGAAVGSQQIGGAMNAIQGEDLSLTQEASLALPTFGTSFVFDDLFGGSGVSKEGDKRHQVSKAFQGLGLWDDMGNTILPDGTVANAFKGDKRNFKNPGADGAGRQLEAYEIDYTNDTDYVAGMAGITLSRIVGGGKEKAIDQNGNLIGNQMLGNVGYGTDFTRDNFNKTMKNARAMYAQAGIQSKDEMLGLANKMYADERISDADYAVMQQTASLVYDNDYNTAKALMEGRNEGIETASKTPAGSTAPSNGAAPESRPGIRDPQSRPGYVRTPGYGPLTPEELEMATAPARESYRRSAEAYRRGMERGSTAVDIASVLTAGGAIAGGIAKIPGAGDFLGDVVSGIGDFLGFGPEALPGDYLEVAPNPAEIFESGSVLETPIDNIFRF